MEGYTGSVEDIDVHLLRGGFEVNNLVILKKNGKAKEPFAQVPLTKIALEWKPVLKGKFVAEITVTEPELNFVFSKDSAVTQTGVENDWTKQIKELTPTKINKLTIKNGKVIYKDYGAKPMVDMSLTNFDVIATNLSNAYDSAVRLPATLKATGITTGNGKLYAQGRMDVLKKIPDFDGKLAVRNMELKSFKDLTESKLKVDIAKGTATFFSEIKLIDGEISGYIKPLLVGVEVLDSAQDKKDGFFKKFWEGLVGVTEDVLKNKKKDQFATKINLKGNLKQIETNPWSVFGNILKNGFVEAFTKSFEGRGDDK